MRFFCAAVGAAPRYSGMGSRLRVKGAEETQGGGGLGSVALGEGGEVEGAIFAEERA